MQQVVNLASVNEPAAVRSIAESIHDLVGTVLFEAGFKNSVLDREDLVEVLRMIEDCREEGRSLYPDILLTTSLSGCLKLIHPLQLVICGESSEFLLTQFRGPTMQQ
jgi:hypothetical protein